MLFWAVAEAVAVGGKTSATVAVAEAVAVGGKPSTAVTEAIDPRFKMEWRSSQVLGNQIQILF